MEKLIFCVVTVSIASCYILLVSLLDLESFLKEFHNHYHSRHYGSFLKIFYQFV